MSYALKNTKKLLFGVGVGMFFMILSSCNDDNTDNNNPKTNADDSTISKTEALDAMVEVLEQRNLSLKVIQTNKRNESRDPTSDGPKTSDYVSTEVNPDGDRVIKLNIGPEGNLIPSSEWQAANPNYCEGEDRFMKAPKKQLVFKVFALPDGYDAFVQYIDIGTGRVEEQREGEATSLDEAMNKAWNKLQTPVGKAVGPCGDKKGFKLTYKADINVEVVGDDGGTTTIKESVAFAISLSYNKDRQFFEGHGKLKWSEYNYSSSAADVTFDCETPPDADVNVIFKAGPEGTPTDSMEGSIEFYNVQQAPCQVTTNGTTTNSPITSQVPTIWLELHKNEADPTLTYPHNPDRNIGYFTMKDWQPVTNNDRVIAKKTYDQSTTKGSGTFTESATIKFAR